MGVTGVIEIEVDKDRCVGALECGICLRACPQGVFRAYPEHRMKGEICTDWSFAPSYKVLCTGCGICEEACPPGAIIITISIDD